MEMGMGGFTLESNWTYREVVEVIEELRALGLESGITVGGVTTGAGDEMEYQKILDFVKKSNARLYGRAGWHAYSVSIDTPWSKWQAFVRERRSIEGFESHHR